MSYFIFFDKITDDDVVTKPGRLPQIPRPHPGDRVQLNGSKTGTVRRVLDKEWATITAISPKNYLIVEPDIKPGEIRITVHDLYRYNRGDSDEEIVVRNPLSLVEWKEFRGNSVWLEKERKYRRKLRTMMRTIREEVLQNRSKLGTTKSLEAV